MSRRQRLIRASLRLRVELSPWSDPFLFAATAAALVVHVAALYLPPTQLILRVQAFDLVTWVWMSVVAGSIILAMELHTWLRVRPGGLGPPT